MSIKIIHHRCPQNHPCPSVKICPTNALLQKGFKAPTVDQDKCINCGKCSKYCPKGAIISQS
ncbi:MAG: 4Fe-4S binding protein [Bacillota bacterium]|jgi:ferredoxin